MKKILLYIMIAVLVLILFFSIDIFLGEKSTYCTATAPAETYIIRRGAITKLYYTKETTCGELTGGTKCSSEYFISKEKNYDGIECKLD